MPMNHLMLLVLAVVVAVGAIKLLRAQHHLLTHQSFGLTLHWALHFIMSLVLVVGYQIKTMCKTLAQTAT